MIEEFKIPPAAWISVKDKVPESYVAVLVYVKRTRRDWLFYEVWIGNLRPILSEGNKLRWSLVKSQLYDHEIEVTHWMPLPLAPVE